MTNWLEIIYLDKLVRIIKNDVKCVRIFDDNKQVRIINDDDERVRIINNENDDDDNGLGSSMTTTNCCF